MKIYIATRLANAKKHSVLRDMLLQEGYELTFDWTLYDNELTRHQPFSKEEYEINANNCLKGVLDADVTILLLPGGLGTHTEFGVALGRQQKIIIVGKQKMYGYSCLFYNCSNVKRLSYNKNLYKNIIKQLKEWS